MNEYDRQYFAKTLGQIPAYWGRFPAKPDFKGAMVMDLGCGQGAMCIDIAKAGARKVIGIDLDERRIRFAQENLEKNYPEFKDVIEFHCVYLHDYPDTPQFDYIVSKNTFEHVFGLKKLLEDLKKRLKPGGKLYTGFGPLYRSPYGDHGFSKSAAWNPWGHLYVSDEKLVSIVNEGRKKESDHAKTFDDLGMNRLKYSEFKDLIYGSGMDVIFFKTNAIGQEKLTRKLMGWAATVFRSIPFLKEYLTLNIYAILQKK